MRDTIMRRRTRISEIQVKGPSRELLRLQAEARQQRVTWPDNYTGMGAKQLPDASRSNGTPSVTKGSTVKHTSLCSYCGKTFDRRAALSTHLKSCPAKSSSSTNTTGTRSSEADSRVSTLQENDETNSNSTDSFMAMLNREKAIQAKILEQEQIIASTTKTEVSEVRSASDKASAVVGVVNKNKRKRFKIHKLPINGDNSELDPNSDSFSKSSRFLDETPRDPAKAKRPKLIPAVDEELLTTDCSMCERKFANLSNLRRHVAMLHYREKKFGCTRCQFQAFRRVDVLNHLATFHGMTGDKQESLVFVRLIALDKNKYSVEKDKAIADAVLRMQQKLPAGIELAADDELLIDESSQCGADGEDIIIPIMIDEELSEFHDIIPMDKYLVKDEIAHDSTLDSAPNQSIDSDLNGFDHQLLNASLLEPAPIPQDRQKRRGRPKGSGNKQVRQSPTAALTPAPYVADTFDPPPKPSKLMRHSSSNSSSSEDQSSRRPVRNRIKAVNKDFVYDMSDLLKTEESRAFGQLLNRPQKRKSLVASAPDDGFLTPTLQPYERSSLTTDPTECQTIFCVKGAAFAMAQQSVLGNRACFNEHSEPPTERPIVPGKIIALRRSVGSDWHVMETPSPSPLHRRASNEQLLDTLTRKTQAFDKLNNSRQSVLEPDVLTEPIATNHRHSLPSDITQSPLPRVENFLDELLKSRNISLDPPSHVTFVETTVKPLSPNVNNNNNHLAVSARQRSIQADDLPRRKTLIERLAEIKTKKIQENMQKLNISSGDENQ